MILNVARRKVITVRPEDSVRSVAGRMEYYNIGSVVVVRDGRPVGIVTDRDLALRALGAEAANGGDELTAADVMTAKPQTIREEDGFDKALEIMRAKGIRRLPVVDRKKRLTGVVTMDDILETLGRNMGAVGAALDRQYKKARRQ
jgi:CBS domain-containing protein